MICTPALRGILFIKLAVLPFFHAREEKGTLF
jgi:hypothetical protein